MEPCSSPYVYNLVQDYLRYACLESRPEEAPSRAAQVLRKVASSLQGEVEENLRVYLDKLEVCSTEEANRIFNQVMVYKFADGITNWGRIVTIFLFGGILGKKLQEHGVLLTADNLKRISQFIADYIVETQGKWIAENGGWDNGFVAKFEDKSPWLSFHWVKTKILDAFSVFYQYY